MGASEVMCEHIVLSTPLLRLLPVYTITMRLPLCIIVVQSILRSLSFVTTLPMDLLPTESEYCRIKWKRQMQVQWSSCLGDAVACLNRRMEIQMDKRVEHEMAFRIMKPSCTRTQMIMMVS